MDVLAVLTNDGREYEIDQLIAGAVMTLSRFRVGTGGESYVPTPAQTDLNTEIAIDFVDITITKLSAKTFKVNCHLDLAAGFEDTISEVGIFTDDDRLFLYGVFDPEVKTNSKEVDMNFTVEL